LLQSNLQIEIPKDLLSDESGPNEDLKTNEVTEFQHKVFDDIEHFMQRKKPFLNADLNLKLLSQLMGISERQISNAINKNTGFNFYTFINQYRVQEAILMLKSEDYAKFSIVGIGEAAGFNSKSSFYNNFRKVTNVSPSRYLQNPS
jgi:AraC-like DNA-binding protein